MSHLFVEDICGHKSIYANNPLDRTIHIEYGIPGGG